jgi:hypothetical protein
MDGVGGVLVAAAHGSGPSLVTQLKTALLQSIPQVWHVSQTVFYPAVRALFLSLVCLDRLLRLDVPSPLPVDLSFLLHFALYTPLLSGRFLGGCLHTLLLWIHAWLLRRPDLGFVDTMAVDVVLYLLRLGLVFLTWSLPFLWILFYVPRHLDLSSHVPRLFGAGLPWTRALVLPAFLGLGAILDWIGECLPRWYDPSVRPWTLGFGDLVALGAGETLPPEMASPGPFSLGNILP